MLHLGAMGFYFQYLVILASLVRGVEILFGVTFLWVYQFEAGTSVVICFCQEFWRMGRRSKECISQFYAYLLGLGVNLLIQTHPFSFCFWSGTSDQLCVYILKCYCPVYFQFYGSPILDFQSISLCAVATTNTQSQHSTISESQGSPKQATRF